MNVGFFFSVETARASSSYYRLSSDDLFSMVVTLLFGDYPGLMYR